MTSDFEDALAMRQHRVDLPPAGGLVAPILYAVMSGGLDLAFGRLIPEAAASWGLAPALALGLAPVALSLIQAKQFRGTGRLAAAWWLDALSAHQRAEAARRNLVRHIIRRRTALAFLPLLAYLAGIASAVIW